ncbi:ATP synthase mitochondrial F1 complex assembly factor 1 isoform X1 [Prunus dulcis]|uniref:ATP synthase mitochondrial F1 complex assembly factor 1 isoform X1 n=1 Tax=Prunus dulcis TaxID=3755 RepID=UPI001481E57F|nr:ATP synthase mitochondrial F1 complex assembly factor 1 isoform X1 [Prunus dulcis]
MRRASRIISLPASNFIARASSSACAVNKHSFITLTAQQNHHNLHLQSFPGDFLKWGSLGFFRTSSFATGFAPLKPKPLGSIIDVERVKDRSAEDIASAWDDCYLLLGWVEFYQFHLGRGHIGASMKANLYHLLEHRAAECRYFVIPLWRGGGYITMFAQVQTPHMLFTGLEDYKAKGTQAAPYFAVTYYNEFAESKDMVLIRGDVVMPSKLSDSEAKWLLETTQSFYVNDTRYKLVERFNRQTHDFEFKDVLQALEIPNL